MKECYNDIECICSCANDMEEEVLNKCTEFAGVVRCVGGREGCDEDFKRLPPWAIRYYELEALFGDDDDLIISLDDETHTATIMSENYTKLDALAQVLKLDNNGLHIELVCTGVSNTYARTIQNVFEGNPHFDNVRIATEVGTGFKHVITTFKDETIQYNADNRFVPGGYETTLAEKIVKDLFKKEYRRSVYVTKDKQGY